MIKTCYVMAPNDEIKNYLLKKTHLKESDLNDYPVDNSLIETAKLTKNITYDLTGEQSINSNSCGYYCLS